MTGEVLHLKQVPKPALPSDTPAALRRLAEDIEAGTVTELVVAYVQDGDYCFLWPSTLIDSITLTTLAQSAAVDRMRR